MKRKIHRCRSRYTFYFNIKKVSQPQSPQMRNSYNSDHVSPVKSQLARPLSALRLVRAGRPSTRSQTVNKLLFRIVSLVTAIHDSTQCQRFTNAVGRSADKISFLNWARPRCSSIHKIIMQQLPEREGQRVAAPRRSWRY